MRYVGYAWLSDLWAFEYQSFDFIFNLLTYASVCSKKDLWSLYKYFDTSLL